MIARWCFAASAVFVACTPPTVGADPDDGAWALTSTFANGSLGDALVLDDGTLVIFAAVGPGELHDQRGNVVANAQVEGCLLARLTHAGDVIWAKAIAVENDDGYSRVFTCASLEGASDLIRVSISTVVGVSHTVMVGDEAVTSEAGIEVDVALDGALLRASASSFRGATTTTLDDGTEIRAGHEPASNSTVVLFGADSRVEMPGVGSPKTYDYVEMKPLDDDVFFSAHVFVDGDVPFEGGNIVPLAVEDVVTPSIGALIGRVSRDGFVWALLADGAEPDLGTTAAFPSIVADGDVLTICGSARPGTTLRDLGSGETLFTFEGDNEFSAFVGRLSPTGELLSLEAVGAGVTADCSYDLDGSLWLAIDSHDYARTRLAKIDANSTRFTASVGGLTPFTTFTSFFAVVESEPIIGLTLSDTVSLDAWVPGVASGEGHLVIARPTLTTLAADP